MNEVMGVVESKSRKGNSIKVDGEWYSTFSAVDLPAEWKDTVSFQWEPDKSGRYKNIKKGTVKVLSSGGNSGTQTSGGKTWSNLGVELGHASNTARDICLAIHGSKAGSDEFYKDFVEHTEKVFVVMKELRTKHEQAEKAVEAPAPKVESPVDTSDLF